jgi:glutathione-regulated potassium-efflux system ancillary protein KefF
MICVIYAHPYPTRSRANRVLRQLLPAGPGIEVRSLYDLYPDFDIDVRAEQAALYAADVIVWMHPVYWYSVPGLLKHWFDQVLVHGWAYGEGGNALRGKRCMWVVTTGGDEAAYSATGMHEQPFANFIPPVAETARFCGMHWESPVVIHGAHLIDEAGLAARGRQLATRLQAWMKHAAGNTPAVAGGEGARP